MRKNCASHRNALRRVHNILVDHEAKMFTVITGMILDPKGPLLLDGLDLTDLLNSKCCIENDAVAF